MPNVCHPWPNNDVICSCSALIPELLYYLLIRDIFLIMKLVNKLLYKYSLNDNLLRILELSWWCRIYICFLFYYVQSNRQMPMRADLLSCYMHQNVIFPCSAIENFIYMNWYLLNEVTCLIRPFCLCPKGDLLIQVLSILAKILCLIIFCTINKLNHDL